MLPHMNNFLRDAFRAHQGILVQQLSPGRRHEDIGKVSTLECLLEDMDLLIQLSILLPLGGYLSHGMQHRRVIPTAK